MLKVLRRPKSGHGLRPKAESSRSAHAQVQPKPFSPAVRAALRLGKFMVPKSILREAALQNRVRNAQASIHRLPPELLEEIMVYTIDWMYWGTWQLRILATVSTYWRDIILTSPRCWAVLDSLHDPEEWKVVQAHNPAGLIDVRFASYSWQSISAFVPVILAEAHRTSTLTIWEDDHELIEQVLGSGIEFPALKDLLVHNSAAEQKVVPSLGEGRHLRHVELYRAGMRWAEPRLSNLTTLCLAALLGIGPTASQLYTILSCSPNLERLRITDWGDIADSSYAIAVEPSPSSSASSLILGPPSPKFPPISLPNLTILITTHLPLEVVAFIYATIRAPACQTMLTTDSVGSNTANNILSMGTRILATANCVILTVEPSSSYIRVNTDPMPGIPATWVLWSKDIPGFDAQMMNVDVKDVAIRVAEVADVNAQFIVMPLVPSDESLFADLLMELEVVRCSKRDAI